MKKTGLQINLLLAFFVLFLAGCHPKSRILEPCITYAPRAYQFQTLPDAFPPLTKQERETPWGQELMIGIKFAKDLDLYRAITSFKRAQMLIPINEVKRRQQIIFNTVACYYLGGKYEDALQVFEKSILTEATTSFPALEDLILILYECYQKTCQCEKAEKILEMIEKASPPTATNLKLSNAILSANFPAIAHYSREHSCEEEVSFFLGQYCRCKKSVPTAQFLNAILPGAGYAYVGQSRSAVTSFVINTLFTWAAYRFFEQKNYAAGLITASIEAGWYLGGINGAGLEAKYYNERIYEQMGKDLMIDCSLFPVLMFQKTF